MDCEVPLLFSLFSHCKWEVHLFLGGDGSQVPLSSMLCDSAPANVVYTICYTKLNHTYLSSSAIVWMLVEKNFVDGMKFSWNPQISFVYSSSCKSFNSFSLLITFPTNDLTNQIGEILWQGPEHYRKYFLLFYSIHFIYNILIIRLRETNK